MNKMFHLFSEGDNVLFRDDSDYIYFNNKFASSCFAQKLEPLAETTMSTHFHSLIEVAYDPSIDEVISKLRKAYSLYYFNRYGHSLGNAFKISKVEIPGRETAMNEMLYIMKNPVHHYVVDYPLKYPYSSVSYIFTNDVVSKPFMDAFNAKLTNFGKLSGRRKLQILGRDLAPDHWKVLDNGMILPSSYINVKRARAFWNNNVRSFMFDMLKNQTDAKQEIIKADVLDLRTSGMTDMDVCRIIDTFATDAGLKSFHQLDDSQIQTLVQILHQKAIMDKQINRCLWQK